MPALDHREVVEKLIGLGGRKAVVLVLHSRKATDSESRHAGKRTRIDVGDAKLLEQCVAILLRRVILVVARITDPELIQNRRREGVHFGDVGVVRRPVLVIVKVGKVAGNCMQRISGTVGQPAGEAVFVGDDVVETDLKAIVIASRRIISSIIVDDTAREVVRHRDQGRLHGLRNGTDAICRDDVPGERCAGRGILDDRVIG